MNTGYIVRGECYATQAAAQSAFWSNSPASITPGSTTFISDVVWSGSGWVMNKYAVDPAGVVSLTSTSALPSVAFETCDPMEKVADGMTLGWLVAVVLVVAFGFRMMQRGW